MSDTGSPEPLVYILGHRYGNTLVPMSADDKENMKYKAVKCFKILGFTNEDKVSEIILNF